MIRGRSLCRGAIIAVVALVPAVNADAPHTELAFEVVRKDKPMGSHTIRLTRQGEDIVAEIAIDLKIRFAFVTLFEYAHRNRETWRDGRLVEIETTTNNNGDRYRITGEATAQGFLVTDGSGIERTFAADILPTSYWHPATTTAQQLLNTQTGELAIVAITPAAPVPGSEHAQRYVVSGDLDLNLWYAGGCLRKLNFRAPRDNSLIDYRQAPGASADSGGACPAKLLESPIRTAAIDGSAL